MREGLEGFSLALFTRSLGWSVDEVQVLLSKARKDMGDRNIHAQNDLYDDLPREPSQDFLLTAVTPSFYVWGRKPTA